MEKKNLLGKTLTCKHRTSYGLESRGSLILNYILTFFSKYTLSKMEFSLIKERRTDKYNTNQWNVRTKIVTIDRAKDLYFYISHMTKYFSVERTFVWTIKYKILFFTYSQIKTILKFMTLKILDRLWFFINQKFFSSFDFSRLFKF